MKYDKLLSKINNSKSYNYEKTEVIRQLINSNKKILQIEKYENEFMNIYNNYSTFLLIGDINSGKTTKIPQILYKYNQNNLKLIHVLPRNLSIPIIVDKVSKEMNLELGKEIGYSILYDYNYNQNETFIKYISDYMFIREIINDNLLKSYNTIIIDDLNEHSLYIDLIVSLLVYIKKKRNDLKIIFCSCTNEYDILSKNFNNCGLLIINDNLSTTDVYYLKSPCKNYIKTTFETIQIIQKENNLLKGDILVILPDEKKIKELNTIFENSSFQKEFIIYRLTSSLTYQNCLNIFQPIPPNKRRIFLSTKNYINIINNVSFVIDCCIENIEYFDCNINSEIEILIKSNIETLNSNSLKAKKGKCYRLITENEIENFNERNIKEIERCDLTNLIILMKVLGIKKIGEFNFIFGINKKILCKCYNNLLKFDLINENNLLNNYFTKKIFQLPINYKYSISIIYSSLNQKFNCILELIAIISMLSIKNIFYFNISNEKIMISKQSKGVKEGDHLSLLSIFKIFKSIPNKKEKQNFCSEIHLNYFAMKEVIKLSEEIKEILIKMNINIKRSVENDGEDILKCFLKGYQMNIAKRQIDSSYLNINSPNQKLFIHPSSVLYTILPEYIIYDEIIFSDKLYMKNISVIKKEWINEVCEIKLKDDLNENKNDDLNNNKKIDNIKNENINIVKFIEKNKIDEKNIIHENKLDNNYLINIEKKNNDDDNEMENIAKNRRKKKIKK